MTEVLKSPVEACPARSGTNKKNTLQEFVRKLGKYPVVTHIVHHDFKRKDVPGRGGMHPMMKNVVLAKSMHDNSPVRISSPLSMPAENSVHLFHLMQHEMPIQAIKTEGSSITTTDRMRSLRKLPKTVQGFFRLHDTSYACRQCYL